MEEKEIKENLKLGAFIFTGLVLFALSVFYLSSQKNLFRHTMEISAIFNDVNGLNKGDNIWLAGVKVGTVKSIEIISDSTVMVQMSILIKKQKYIKKDAAAYVGSDGFVGNRIVVITPGLSDSMVEASDTLGTEKSAGTHDILNTVKQATDNAVAITNDLKIITRNLQKGEGAVGALLADQQLADAVKQTFLEFDITGRNTATISGDLSILADNLIKGRGMVGALLTDTTHTKMLDHTLLNVEMVGNNLARVSGDLSQLSQKLESQQSALGVVLTDTAFAANLRRSMENIQSGTKKIEQDAEAAQHNFLLRGYFKKKRKKDS